MELKPLDDHDLQLLRRLVASNGVVPIADGLAKIADEKIKEGERDASKSADKTKLRQWKRVKSDADKFTQRMLDIGPGSECR